jgi:peptidoglycan/xylan/chitin deacetylase (PgdA/CDA1 family)
VAEFQSDLETLLRGRRALSLSDFLAGIANDGEPPRRSFLLTFDDGFREMHDVVLPILRRQGVPAVFFLNSASFGNAALCHHQKIALLLDHRARHAARFPEAAARRLLGGPTGPAADAGVALRALPWREQARVDALATLCGLDFAAYLRTQRPYLGDDEARALLAAGMDLGAHSIDHPRYADLTLEEQLRQTRASLTFVATRFAPRHLTFAFPHTDRGVSRQFFAALGPDGLAATFGTSAPQREALPRHHQRFTMEKTDLPASALLARHHLRSLRAQWLPSAPARP